MQLWAQFYAAIGTASAALLGLLFVTVSINVPAALGPEQAVSRRLTEQAFQNYLAVMMVAFLASFPGIDATTFGLVTLITTAGWSVWVVIRLCQTLGQRLDRRSWIYSVRRHVSSLVGFGILLVSAFRMALNWGTSYNLLAASTPGLAVLGDYGVLGVAGADRKPSFGMRPRLQNLRILTMPLAFARSMA